jgi:hypothetical protein
MDSHNCVPSSTTILTCVTIPLDMWQQWWKHNGSRELRDLIQLWWDPVREP